MGDKTKVVNYDTERVNLALARLHFGKDLSGSNWLSDGNRDSIGRTVHYGNQCFISESPLTLGGLIDVNPSYVADACARVLAAGKAITREEFLASFLELLLTKDRTIMLKLSGAIEQLNATDAERFQGMMESYLVAQQIPAENLYTALGVYVLQKAHDQGIIAMTDKVAYQGYRQQLEAKS